jgi:hypothetical protein
VELAKVTRERWRKDLRDAGKCGISAPLPPVVIAPREPQAPRLRQHDVTIEKVAELLAHAAPKGLLIVRDELAGWITGMNAYNGGGRAFLDRGLWRAPIPGGAKGRSEPDHRSWPGGRGLWRDPAR